MCGIAGFVGYPNKSRSVLTRMLDCIVHRGPNSAGIHIDGPLAMGMRRLSIIDLSGGDQPISNASGTIWTVSNGEIYNFREVRSELQQRGYRFRTESDTEVIVHAYEHWGESFVDHLEGMFGTALWDKRQQKLLLLRDRLGIKPLYYAPIEPGLAFGSEMKSIFAGGFIDPKVDEMALENYLAFGFATAPRTIAKGVSKLAPGEMLVWKNGRSKLHKYWKLSGKTRSSPAPVEQTFSELQNAVTSHLVSDVPLGAFLSGGVDSSGIVGIMDDSITEPINTYAIGYKGNSVADYYNELPFAAEVAQTYGTRHREIAVQPNVIDLLPKLMWHLEEPISDTATMTTFLVSKMAKETVTVIMSGVGGDELFAGYRRYLGDYYGEKYAKIPHWLRSALVEPLVGLLPSGRANRLQDLGRYAKEFVATAGLTWAERYTGYMSISDAARVEALTGLHTHASQDFLNVCNQVESSDPLTQLMAVDLQTQLPEALLLLSDKMTMACSIECRVPFLHHPLVEYAGGIPAGTKAPKGNQKAHLKNALSALLPDSVLNRAKRGFGAPVGSWLKREIAPLADTLLARDIVAKRELLDPDAVNAILDDHRSNRQDYTDMIMVLMNLELWCRIFQDGSNPADISAELTERVAG